MRLARWQAVVVTVLLAGELPHSAGAQLASLLKDLDPRRESSGSAPIFLGTASGLTYFSALDSGTGRSLLSTDGTPQGTRVLETACAETCSGYYTSLGLAGENLFLTRSPDGLGDQVKELIAVTGNPSRLTSVLSADEAPSIAGASQPGASAILGEELFLFVSSGPSSATLTASNGNEDGLRAIRQFEHIDLTWGLQRVGAGIFFWVFPEGQAPELWRTDGTTAGTRFVKAVAIDVERMKATAVGERTYLFTASDEAGLELWSSDGSASGTRRLTSFPDPAATVARIEVSPTRAFLFVEDLTFGQELWTSDGTAAGTRAATSFGFHRPFGTDLPAAPLAIAGEQAFFLATDGLTATGLWVAGPGTAPARLVIETCASDCFYDPWIAASGSRAFFLRSDPETGTEVWSSDGTSTGTDILFDACPGGCSGNGLLFGAELGTLVYAASESGYNDYSVLVARSPWSSAASLVDPLRHAPKVLRHEQLSFLVDSEHLYFGAHDGEGGPEPWVSGGESASTFQLAGLAGEWASSSTPRNFASSSGTVAWRAETETFTRTFWLSDGTFDGTRKTAPVGYFTPDPNAPIHPLGSRFVTHGVFQELLAIEPATSQTMVIAQMPCSYRIASEVLGSDVVMAWYCQNTEQIWTTDGTFPGTVLRFTFPPSLSFRSGFEKVNGKLLFQAYSLDERIYALAANLTSVVPITGPGVVPDSLIYPQSEPLGFFSHGGQLFRTDGTAQGTWALGPPVSGRTLMGATRSTLGYDLLLRTASGAVEIWTTDGSPAGSLPRSTLPIETWSSSPAELRRLGAYLFVILEATDQRTTLWSLADGGSDSTALQAASMTRRSSASAVTAVLGDRLVFSGCEPARGCELWVSDGTPAGTRLIQDIYPGRGASYPSEFFVEGGILYFAAQDGLHGIEPWTLNSASTTGCHPTEHSLCLESGRFQAVAFWTDFSGRIGEASAVAITPDTGYFWFFDEDNVELILKLIDGGGFNGHHWVYYGALSNVEYTFTVTDSQTGAAKRYFNPATRFASSGDITAFGPNGAHAAGGPSEAETLASTPPDVSLAAFSAPQSLPGTCVPTPTRFCILNNRFAVTATWRDFAGHTGTASAGTLTDDTGYLWFFNEANVEVVLKMVDAGAFNQHFWVYYGALSNVEYTLTVTDTVAGGPPRVYRNPLGQFGSFGDIEAFPAP